VNESGNITAAPSLGDEGLIRSLLALLTPFLALALELVLWDVIQPFAWFLFYPAIFVSASLGGRRSGLMATAISAFLVWWFFLRPANEISIDPRHLLWVAVFSATGVAFAFFHDRLTRALSTESAKQQLETDLHEMTRLHQRVNALASERRIFEALIENSPDFIGIADAKGNPTYLNPAGRRLVGLSPEFPVEATRISDYYVPEKRAFAEEVIVPGTIDEGFWQGDTFFRNWQTDAAIPVSDRHFMIRDLETDRLIGMATIARDVSELWRAQAEVQSANAELVQARAFVENVLESSTEYSIIAKDLDRRVLAWNKGAARIYGYDQSEVVGKSSDMLHVPEELESGAVEALHRLALEVGKATGLFRRRRKDGTEFIARVVITRRDDAAGNPVGYLLVSHDVTAEQQQLERQQFLAEVGAALQASLDYSPTIERIAKLVVDYIGDGCAIDVLEDIGKLRRMRVVHADPEKTGLADALDRFLPERHHPVWRVLETGQPILYPDVPSDLLRSVAKDDEHLSLLEALDVRSAMLVPLVLSQRVIAVLSIVSCRPDRKYGPEDLGLAEELARRASLALDNARLYEVAQEAILARDHVLGVVAHDLRNPLGTILSATSLLRRRDGPERRSRKPIEAIDRAVDRMGRLIRDLLDVTRIEASGLLLESTRISPRDAITEAVEAERTLAASVCLELRLEVEQDLPEVCADRDRLHQIFENLIGNALKFTERGSISVGAEPHGSEVLFWVKDTGPGIPSEHLPHLFDRFWQAREARRRGTGLGLPIVKGLVEAHGGRVWVESTLGIGTSFYFTIPTAASREEPARNYSISG
jgi:PAS domain S-box-containing protein